MSEINREPADVDQKETHITFNVKDKLSMNEIIDRLKEVETGLLNQHYTSVKLGLERRSKEEIDLVIFGSRKENDRELEARVIEEEAKAKFVKEQQLKEYLRLKKIFETA